MVKIGKPYIVDNVNSTRCVCAVQLEDVSKEIWFEVEKEYSQYLCDDRVDAYVVGILWWAMFHAQDIVCESPVTEQLLYNINNILIPSVTKYAKRLKRIKVIAEKATPLMMGEFVGTGCSCGVDSFYSIETHTSSEFTNMNISHLVINNVGSFHDCYKECGVEHIRNERYKKANEVAANLKLPLIKTNSNFADCIKQNHYLTNTYSSCFAIFMLQKMWKIYYLSSVGLDYSSFSLFENDIEDSAHYDLLTLQCFSIPGLQIISDGGEKTRLEKTSVLANNVLAKKYLHVCTEKEHNCGVCGKCKRTLLCLDALDMLENFVDVFNIDYYIKHRKMYYGWLIVQHFDKDEMNEPTYQLMKNRSDFRGLIVCFWFIWVIRKVFRLLKKMINN